MNFTVLMMVTILVGIAILVLANRARKNYNPYLDGVYFIGVVVVIFVLFSLW